jgi:hypothetical protein
MVVVVHRKLSSYADASHIFAVKWPHALDGVLYQILLRNSIASYGMAIV